MTERVSYSGTMIWRDQPGVRVLVDRAAVAKGTKASEWLRQAVRLALQLDGFNPGAIPARDAGALRSLAVDQDEVARPTLEELDAY